MTIGVFFDSYMPHHETKEMGQIVSGFLDLGIEAELITIKKKELQAYNAPFPMIQISKEESYTSEFWRKFNKEIIILYTWLLPEYNTIINIIKNSGKLVIIKGDTDGRITFPLGPRVWYIFKTIPPLEGIKNILRRIKGTILTRSRVSGTLEQIIMSDAIVVESPYALSNLSYLLNSWNKPELIQKLNFVPQPISLSGDIFSVPIINKKKIVISVANWNSYLQKNSFAMMNILKKFLSIRKDYRAIVIGKYEQIKFGDINDRIEIMGNLLHQEVLRLMLDANISFLPSIFEGFNLAISESLCMGCSFVGTPIECFHYLSRGGIFGTISSNFSEQSILSALISDSIKWDRNEYNSDETARFWRNEFSRDKVAKKFLKVINTIGGIS